MSYLHSHQQAARLTTVPTPTTFSTMKYSLITSSLVLASTVVASIPPTYQNNYNNGNVEASPVVSNKPTQTSGTPYVTPVGNSKPVQNVPSGNGQQNYPQQKQPIQKQPEQKQPMEKKPEQKQPSNNNYVHDYPVNSKPIVEGVGIKPVPIRQGQGIAQPVVNTPTGSGYQQKGVIGGQQGNTVASPVGTPAFMGGPNGIVRPGSGLMSNCLSQQEAQQFVQRFSGVLDQSGSDLGDANVTARALVSEDFVEHSNSILSVQGLPTGDGIAAKDKATWLQGITHAPASRGIVTLDVDVTCDVIYWHWVFNQIGSGEYPVKGFNRFEMSRSGQGAETLQAHRMDLEFDSIAWGLNGQVKSCTFPDGRVIGGSSTGSAPASMQS